MRRSGALIGLLSRRRSPGWVAWARASLPRGTFTSTLRSTTSWCGFCAEDGGIADLSELAGELGLDLVCDDVCRDTPDPLWMTGIELHEALCDRAVVKGHRGSSIAAGESKLGAA